jgi:hypothetical protein
MNKKIILVAIFVFASSLTISAQESYEALRVAFQRGTGVNSVFKNKFIYMGNGSTTSIGSIITVRGGKLDAIEYDAGTVPEIGAFLKPFFTQPIEGEVVGFGSKSSSIGIEALLSLPTFNNLSAEVKAKFARSRSAKVALSGYSVIRLQEGRFIRDLNKYYDSAKPPQDLDGLKPFPNNQIVDFYENLESDGLAGGKQVIVAVVSLRGLKVEMDYAKSSGVNAKAEAQLPNDIKVGGKFDAAWTGEGKLQVSIPSDQTFMFVAVRDLEVYANEVRFKER